MSTTADTRRARTKGIRIAAKVATAVGIAFAAIGAAEAKETAPTSAAKISDEAKPLPFADWVKVNGARAGNCGCTACWGPPAPPHKTARPIRRLVERKRGGR